MSEYKVEVRGLCKNFGSLEVLKDVNFNVRKGEFVCVVGPTGCGKTTFLNTLTCLLEPSSGEILIDGERANPKKHDISFVFQEPSALPWLTVEDNIAFGMKLKGWSAERRREQTERIISLMGLAKCRKQYPHQLSVSTEQKVVIGRAFAMQPDLLLMDEPYGQMDVKTRFYLEDEVVRLWQELGSTVLFITHNVEEACYLADRILILSNKPASVKEDLKLDMPRPRDIASEEFISLRVHVESAIKWW